MKTFIHHIIEIKANRHDELIEYTDEELMTPEEWVHILHDKNWDWHGFLWAFNYYETMIGEDRSMTKEEYKKTMHDIRKESWEFDKNHDDHYPTEEPMCNPGGGPYNIEDCR